MLGKSKIKRDAEEIDFLGIAYAKPPIIVHETDTHLLVHVKSGQYRIGAYGYAYAPALYMLVAKVDDGTVDVIREERPGKNWRKVRAELIDSIDSME